MSHNEPLHDDLLDGAADYAEFLNWPKRRVFYYLERGELPGKKLGRRWVGSKRKVREHLTGEAA